MREREAIDILREVNEEFRRLEKEHRNLDNVIDKYSKMRFLSSDDEIEKRKLQKLKLSKKDKMAQIIRQYKQCIDHKN